MVSENTLIVCTAVFQALMNTACRVQQQYSTVEYCTVETMYMQRKSKRARGVAALPQTYQGWVSMDRRCFVFAVAAVVITSVHPSRRMKACRPRKWLSRNVHALELAGDWSEALLDIFVLQMVTIHLLCI